MRAKGPQRRLTELHRRCNFFRKRTDSSKKVKNKKKKLNPVKKLKKLEGKPKPSTKLFSLIKTHLEKNRDKFSSPAKKAEPLIKKTRDNKIRRFRLGGSVDRFRRREDIGYRDKISKSKEELRNLFKDSDKNSPTHQLSIVFDRNFKPPESFNNKESLEQQVRREKALSLIRVSSDIMNPAKKMHIQDWYKENFQREYHQIDLRHLNLIDMSRFKHAKDMKVEL